MKNRGTLLNGFVIVPFKARFRGALLLRAWPFRLLSGPSHARFLRSPNLVEPESGWAMRVVGSFIIRPPLKDWRGGSQAEEGGGGGGGKEKRREEETREARSAVRIRR